MKLTAALASFVLTLLPISNGITVNVTYDTVYDQRSTSLTTVACSDGKNGLITRGYSTFGSLTKFPYIGGGPTVTGWNSTSCGSCWSLFYKTSKNVSTSITVVAIDVASPTSFNIALAALDSLTGNEAVQLGRITANATQVDAAICGLSILRIVVALNKAMDLIGLSNR